MTLVNFISVQFSISDRGGREGDMMDDSVEILFSAGGICEQF